MTGRLSPSPPRIPLEKINYVELWRYFEERGSSLKDSFLAMMTWVLGFAGALVAFMSAEALEWKGAHIQVVNPFLLLIISAVGLGLVTFSHRVIIEFGGHINRNFDRADHALEGNATLDEILAQSEQPAALAKKLPTICRQVRTIAYSFGALFCLGAVLAVVLLI